MIRDGSQQVKSVESYGFMTFHSSSLDIYFPKPKNFNARATVTDEGKIFMPLDENSLLIAQALSLVQFRLPSEGLTDFVEVPQYIIDEMNKTLYASSDPIKTSGKKKDMKIEY